MKCKKCGKELKGQESFCTKCGAKIPQNYIMNAVNRYKGGDNTAFEIIYRESYATVKVACLSVIGTGNLVQLEDLVQESYLRIIKGLKTYDPEKANFFTWAGKVAVNTVISELRKKNVEIVPLVQEVGDEEISLEFEDEKVEYQPELQYEASEREAIIRDILQELSERQRECIVLYYMNQMKVAEIADILDMQESAVKVNLHRGRKKVEERVTAMEKQGIKLLGLTPIVFFASLLVSEKEAYAKESAVSFVESGIGMLASWEDAPDLEELSEDLGDNVDIMNDADITSDANISENGNVPSGADRLENKNMSNDINGTEQMYAETPGVEEVAGTVTKHAGKAIAKKIVIGLAVLSVAVGGGYAVGHQSSGTDKKEASADEKKAEKKKDVRVVEKKEEKKEEPKEEEQTEETTTQETEQPVEEAMDPLQIYGEVLEEYYHAWRGAYASSPDVYPYVDFNLKDAYYYSIENELYYCIYDFCGDGMPELCIGTRSNDQNGEAYYTIWDMYSTDNTSVARVVEKNIDYKSTGYNVFAGGIIEMHSGEPGNAGGSEFYQLSAGQMQATWIDGIYHDGALQSFSRADGSGNYTEISIDEYQQIQAQYSGTDMSNQLIWTPISDLYY